MSDRDANPASCIRPNLYLGPESKAYDREWLKSAGITHVLSCLSGAIDDESDGIRRLKVPMSDTGVSDLDEVFGEAFEFMAEGTTAPGKKCLVHCKLGINRSPTVVVGWLMAAERLTLKDSYWTVHRSRPGICLHDGYMEQLRQFDAQLFGKNSTAPDELPTTSSMLNEFRRQMNQPGK